MNLSPGMDRAISEALQGVVQAAIAAADQRETDAIKTSLQAVWHATRHAYELTKSAEEAARSAALSNLEHAA